MCVSVCIYNKYIMLYHMKFKLIKCITTILWRHVTNDLSIHVYLYCTCCPIVAHCRLKYFHMKK